MSRSVLEARCPNCGRLLFKHKGGKFLIIMYTENTELITGDSIQKCTKCKKPVLVRQKSIV